VVRLFFARRHRQFLSFLDQPPNKVLQAESQRLAAVAFG
jgi:hypothetical protein